MAVSDSTRDEIESLLALCRVGFLSSLGESGPETSMAPFAMFNGNLLLHLSGLARHSKNLRQNPRAGFMICSPERDSESVLALPRLSLQGDVVTLWSGHFDDAKAAYLARIGDAARLFDFPDFNLCMLDIDRIYWVGGFGSAREIPLAAWQRMLIDR